MTASYAVKKGMGCVVRGLSLRGPPRWKKYSTKENPRKALPNPPKVPPRLGFTRRSYSNHKFASKITALDSLTKLIILVIIVISLVKEMNP